MRTLSILLLCLTMTAFYCYSIDEAVEEEMAKIEDFNAFMGITVQEETIAEKLYKMTMPKKVFQLPQNNCDKREPFKVPQYFQFIPELKAKLFKVGDSVEFGNYCFQKNTVTLLSMTEDTITVNILAEEPMSKMCRDQYIFHTTAIKQLSDTFMKGDHTVTIKNLKPINFEEIALGGLRLFSFCDDIKTTTASAYKTYKLLMSDFPHEANKYESLSRKVHQTPEEQEDEHKEFLHLYGGFNIEQRYGNEDTVLPLEDLIQTGDFLGLSQVINGESCLIQYITGGRISHSAIAVRIDGKLHVAESENAGIFIRTYEEFIQEQIRSYHSVAWFPLSDESRAKISEQKIIDYVKKREGDPYGFKTFIFPQIDSKTNNLPDYIPFEAIMLILSFLEKFSPEMSLKFLGHGLNMRLGTSNLTIAELGEEATRQGKTLEDVIIMPEKDDYVYFDGENLVCSTLVVAAYKDAGLFGDLDINSHEFTPKDIYQMDIYKKNFKNQRPAVCQEADPELDYCQIMGKFRINAHGYNTVKPYAHMNDNCECLPPTYFRPQGC